MSATEVLIGLVAGYADDVDPKTILDDLNAKTIIETTPELQTYKYMAVIYGAEFTATVLGKLKAAGAQNPLLDATYYAMCSTGLDFSRDLTQGMIEQLRGTLFTDDEADKLAWMGVQKYSILDKKNMTNTTVEDVQAAVNAKISRRDNLSWFNDIFNTVLPQLQAGTITRDEIKALVNS